MGTGSAQPGAPTRGTAQAGCLGVPDTYQCPARPEPSCACVAERQPPRSPLLLPGLNGDGNREGAAERTAPEHSPGWISRGPRCLPMSRASTAVPPTRCRAATSFIAINPIALRKDFKSTFITPARCLSPHPSRVRGSPHPFSKKGAGSDSPYQFFSNCLWCGEASQNW